MIKLCTVNYVYIIIIDHVHIFIMTEIAIKKLAIEKGLCFRRAETEMCPMTIHPTCLTRG